MGRSLQEGRWTGVALQGSKARKPRIPSKPRAFLTRWQEPQCLGMVMRGAMSMATEASKSEPTEAARAELDASSIHGWRSQFDRLPARLRL